MSANLQHDISLALSRHDFTAAAVTYGHWLQSNTQTPPTGAKAKHALQLPYNLHGGSAGHLLFYLALYEATQQPVWLAAAGTANNQTARLLSTTTDAHMGLYAGRMGALLAMRAYELVTNNSIPTTPTTPTKLWVSLAQQHTPMLERFITSSKVNPGLYDGLAGAILGMQVVQAEVPGWQPLLAQAFSQLLSTMRPHSHGVYFSNGQPHYHPLLGWAHGNAGIAQMFTALGPGSSMVAELTTATTNVISHYCQQANNAVPDGNAAVNSAEKLQQLLHAYQHNQLPTTGPPATTLANGAAGVCIASLAQTRFWASTSAKLIPKLFVPLSGADQSLYYGTAGHVLALVMAWRKLRDTTLQLQAKQFAVAVWPQQNTHALGLLGGATGHAYTWLLLAHPQLPATILFQPTGTRQVPSLQVEETIQAYFNRKHYQRTYEVIKVVTDQPELTEPPEPASSSVNSYVQQVITAISPSTFADALATAHQVDAAKAQFQAAMPYTAAAYAAWYAGELRAQQFLALNDAQATQCMVGLNPAVKFVTANYRIGLRLPAKTNHKQAFDNYLAERTGQTTVAFQYVDTPAGLAEVWLDPFHHTLVQVFNTPITVAKAIKTILPLCDVNNPEEVPLWQHYIIEQIRYLVDQQLLLCQQHPTNQH